MKFSMKSMTKVAMMAAIIFVCIFTFKIPNVLTGGYTHLGDCAIFVGVLVLGRKKGALAAGMGAALSDLIGGFLFWVVPTFIIKFVMAYVMGTVIEKLLPQKRFNWLIGAVLGGICQIIGYQVTKFFLISPAVALATLPNITAQTVIGIVLSTVIIGALQSSKILNRLQQI